MERPPEADRDAAQRPAPAQGGKSGRHALSRAADGLRATPSPWDIKQGRAHPACEGQACQGEAWSPRVRACRRPRRRWQPHAPAYTEAAPRARRAAGSRRRPPPATCRVRAMPFFESCCEAWFGFGFGFGFGLGFGVGVGFGFGLATFPPRGCSRPTRAQRATSQPPRQSSRAAASCSRAQAAPHASPLLAARRPRRTPG